MIIEKLILAFVIAFLIAVTVGKVLAPWLRRIKAGQSIKEKWSDMVYDKGGNAYDGWYYLHNSGCNRLHNSRFFLHDNRDYKHIFVLFLALAFGAVGFIDDYEKLKKAELGLTRRKKVSASGRGCCTVCFPSSLLRLSHSEPLRSVFQC